MEIYDPTEAEHVSGLPFDTLTRMARCFPVSAIVSLRQNQVAEFSRPQRTGDKLGFEILPAEGEGDKQKISEVNSFFETCGTGNIAFSLFLKTIVRDSLIYDQACFEIIKNRGGKTVGMVPLDSTSIRRRKPTEEEKEQGELDPNSVWFIQKQKNSVVAEFGRDDLCFGVRRPRTDLAYSGYGHPELEELVQVVTRLLQCEEHNAQTFAAGSTANYLIAIKSKMAPSLFRTFRRDWAKMLASSNRNKTPMIQLDPDGHEGVETHALKNRHDNSVGFQEWTSYLLKVACATYCTDPAELGFNFIGEGLDRALHSPGPGEKILASKEKGLRPILRSIESWFNLSLMPQLAPGYLFRFCGLDALSQGEALDMDLKRLRFMTINEVRDLRGLPPIEGGDKLEV